MMTRGILRNNLCESDDEKTRYVRHGEGESIASFSFSFFLLGWQRRVLVFGRCGSNARGRRSVDRDAREALSDITGGAIVTSRGPVVSARPTVRRKEKLDWLATITGASRNRRVFSF